MNICLIGGIYGKPAAFRQTVTFTPETILENGLRARGHTVTTLSHYDLIPQSDFDIIHVHHLSWGALRAACSPGHARLVFTTHAMPANGSTISPLREWAARYVIARADAVVALSQTEADYQRFAYPVRGARHEIIPNAIDTETFRYARRNGADDGHWRLLYVGQLIRLKCVDILLHALSDCCEDIHLDLAFHNDRLRPELEALAAQLGLAARVHFLGQKQPHELAHLYQEADIFVLPSARETLPSVITEAMTCGTPVIATDVGAVREQLGGYGLLVAPESPEALAQAIRYMIYNYASYVGQGEAMSRRARELFSLDTMVRRHVELYADLAADSSGIRRGRAGTRVLVPVVRNVTAMLSRRRRAAALAHCEGRAR